MRLKIHSGVVAAAYLLVAVAVLAQREPPVQKELRERVGEWADNYTASLPSYTALETVRLTQFGRKGKASGEREAIYQYTLKRSAENAREFEESRTRAATGESGGNAGKAQDSSVGQFTKAALLVTRFATRYQERMKYFFVPEHPDSISEAVVVGYRQISGDGLMEVEGKLVFPTGRAWIDPESGKITRIEEEFGAMGKTRYFVSVDFTDDAPTGAWLPSRVTVRVFDKDRLEKQNEYTYSEFRSLQTTAASPSN